MNDNGTTLSGDLTGHHMRLTDLVTLVSSLDRNGKELSQNIVPQIVEIKTNSNFKSQIPKTLLFFQFLKKCLGMEREARVWAREERNDIVRFFTITSRESRSLLFIVWLARVE